MRSEPAERPERAVHRRLRRTIICLAVALCSAAAIAGHSPGTASGKVIIGYVFARDGVLDPSTIAADELTHINYAFANVRDGKVVEGFPGDAENFRVLAGLRREHPALKLLVSVGGWTWSGGFSDAVLTPDRRHAFVASAVDFVRRHDLDGFDVDWEYPGLPGFGNPHRPEDKEHFTALMADLRTALDKEGREQGRKYLLTFAAGAFADYLDHTEMGKVQATVDFVNLMTYDFRVPEADPIAGHHANLFENPADPDHQSADRVVKAFLAAGVPPEKLVLGVPFYGRAWADVAAGRNGLYQAGKPPADEIDAGYGNLAANMIGKSGFVRFWDSEAQAPYLWNADRRTFITYDDPESLRLKAGYINQHHLAGAMFWQYYDDPSGALLDALHEGLRDTSRRGGARR